MIRSYLDTLSDRERLLLMVAGTLVGVLILLLGIINPILSFRDNAQRDYADATRMAALSGRIAQASQQSNQAAGSLRSLVTERARAEQLVIARIADSDGSVDLVFSDAPYGAFFEWLRVLTEEDGLIVREALIRPGTAPQSVNVRLTLER